MNYDSLLVAIGYRGKQLGHVTSDGGNIKAREASYVNATLQLEHVEILTDVVFLLEDLAKGAITFDTESEIGGKLQVFFFDLPLKVNLTLPIQHDASFLILELCKVKRLMHFADLSFISKLKVPTLSD